jgi:hypothetical protein
MNTEPWEEVGTPLAKEQHSTKVSAWGSWQVVPMWAGARSWLLLTTPEVLGESLCVSFSHSEKWE